MSDSPKHGFNLPPEQQAIRDKCFHPSRTGVEFAEGELERSIPEQFQRIVQGYGERTALIAPCQNSLTYACLFEQISHFVEALNNLGIGRGDRVALVLPDGAQMAAAFLGITAAATCAPLNPAYREQEYSSLFSDLKPKALVVESGAVSAAIAAAERALIPIIEISLAGLTGSGHLSLHGAMLAPTTQRGFARADDVALMLFTSGTTARPKLVPLTHANLLASARNIAATLELTPDDRCLNIMPLFHIHGLVGALLSSVTAGASVICIAGLDIEQFFPWLEAFRPTWYTAVPTIHHAVLARAQAEPTALRNHSLRFIRSSSAPLPARVMQGLEETFKVPVIESYGMTEAAHQMASNPVPPVQRKAGSVGPAAGPQVSIMDEAGKLLSTGEIGEIVIRGANVMGGYDNNSDANAKAFTQGWFRTGDQGYLDGDGYLFITGRLKEIINRGGEKISPREVDEVILQHPAVAEAISFAMPHETLGEDIAAAIVTREKTQITEAAIRAYLSSRLAAHKIPSRILFVDEIPKGATGKTQRIGLAEKFTALLSNVMTADFLAPQTQVQKTLAAIWSEVLGVEHIGIQDNFFNLGGDSIRATQVISRIRAYFNYDIPLRTLFEAPTVEDLATMIIRQQARQVSETEMERLLDELDGLSSEDAEQGYKEQLTKSV